MNYDDFYSVYVNDVESRLIDAGVSNSLDFDIENVMDNLYELIESQKIKDENIPEFIVSNLLKNYYKHGLHK